MKKLSLTLCLLFAGAAVTLAQTYMTRTGKITFDASGNAETVTAINNEAATILDAKTGEIIFQVPVKSFKFERELMQEHFNENYMESDKYPKADFKGIVTNMKDMNLGKDGTYAAKVSGKLTIHGVTNDITSSGVLIVKGNTIMVKAKFAVKLHDYKIDIPSVVADKVNKEASISVESNLALK